MSVSHVGTPEFVTNALESSVSATSPVNEGVVHCELEHLHPRDVRFASFPTIVRERIGSGNLPMWLCGSHGRGDLNEELDRSSYDVGKLFVLLPEHRPDYKIRKGIPTYNLPLPIPTLSNNLPCWWTILLE